MTPYQFILPPGVTYQAKRIHEILQGYAGRTEDTGHTGQIRYAAYVGLAVAIQTQSAYDWVTTSNLVGWLLRAAHHALQRERKLEQKYVLAVKHLTASKGKQ